MTTSPASTVTDPAAAARTVPTSADTGSSTPRCGDTRTGALRIGDAYFNARHDRIEVLTADGTWQRVTTPKQIRAAAVDGTARVLVTPAGHRAAASFDVPTSSLHGKGGPVTVTSTDPAPLVAALWHGLATGRGPDRCTAPDVYGASLTLVHGRAYSDDVDGHKHQVEIAFADGTTVTGATRDPDLGDHVAALLATGVSVAGLRRFAEHPVGQQIVAQLPNVPFDLLATAAANPDAWPALAARPSLPDDVIVAALNAGAEPASFVRLASPALRAQVVDYYALGLLFDDPISVAVVSSVFAVADGDEQDKVLSRCSDAVVRELAAEHPEAFTAAQIDRFFPVLGADVAVSLPNVDPRVFDWWVRNADDAGLLGAALANPSTTPAQRQEVYRRLVNTVGAAEAERVNNEALARRLDDPVAFELVTDRSADTLRRLGATDPTKAVLFADRAALAALSDDELVTLARESELAGALVRKLPPDRLAVFADPDVIPHWATSLGASGVAAVVAAATSTPDLPAGKAAAVLHSALEAHTFMDEPSDPVLTAALRSPHPEVHAVVVDRAAAWAASPVETRASDGQRLLAALAHNPSLDPDLLARVAAIPGFAGHAVLVRRDPARVEASLTVGVRSSSHLTAVAAVAAFAPETLTDTARAAVVTGLRDLGGPAAAARPDPVDLVALCRLHVTHRAELSAADPTYRQGRETVRLVQTALREAVRCGQPDLAFRYVDAITSDPVLSATTPGLAELVATAYRTESQAIPVHRQAHAVAATAAELHSRIEELNALIDAQRWRDVVRLPHRHKVRRALAEQLATQVAQLDRIVDAHPSVFADPRLAPPGTPVDAAAAARIRDEAGLLASWQRTWRKVFTANPAPAPRR